MMKKQIRFYLSLTILSTAITISFSQAKIVIVPAQKTTKQIEKVQKIKVQSEQERSAFATKFITRMKKQQK